MKHHTIDQRERQSSGPMKRSWLMVVGCSLPLVAVLLLPLLGVSWGTVLVLLMLLVCPLMHLLGMHSGHGGHEGGQSDDRGSKS